MHYHYYRYDRSPFRQLVVDYFPVSLVVVAVAFVAIVAADADAAVAVAIAALT